MKMNPVFILFFLFSSTIVLSQDIDIYQKGKNDNYNMPKIDQKMSFDEFELLAQNVKMKDMLYATIVPGHIHFKAKSKKMGRWLVGLRGASFATIGGVYWYANNNYRNIKLDDIKNQDDAPPLKEIVYGAVGVAVSTYLFDLIRGEHVLKKKQEKIRYKYSIRLQTQCDQLLGWTGNPVIGLSLNF